MMVQPKCYRYSNRLCQSPLVCSVDDAWFEGNRDWPSIFNEMELRGIHREPRSLDKLCDKLAAQRSKLSSGDAQYIFALAQICSAKGFDLELCNFEAFQVEWSRLNARGTAVLLDLNYTLCPGDASGESYGLRAIHSLLSGVRPKADIFIVTGGPKAFHDEMAARAREPSWWPVRAFPVVSKENTSILAEELKCFADYFQQGLESAAVELLRSLVRAHNDGYTWSHPIHSFDEIPRDLGLYSLYERDVSSIKALFHNLTRYPMRPTVLSAIWATSGYSVELQDGFPDQLWLAQEPFGALWVAQVWDVLNLLSAQADACTCQVATLKNDGDLCILTVPLNTNYEGRLKAAIENNQHQGETTLSVLALEARRLREGLILRLADKERQVLNELLTAHGHGSPYHYRVNATDAALTVEWKGIFG